MNHKHTNQLIHESSPYLLQHAHNPVHWHPWNDETLHKAKSENKFILISIGYSACHWCHVMEHESFEDELVAAMMNDNFICIKVDREERPDVDQIYMHAAHLITGRGGWPLNAFALPDGKPFYAGTYFPKDNWMYVMEQIVNLKENEPEKLTDTANKITNGIRQMDTISTPQILGKFQSADFDVIFDNILEQLDFEKGGKKRAPKFPMPCFWEYLLHYQHQNKNSEALNAVEITLQKMAAGGIYDQIGGGFARYSTDEDWFVPHFEKMLYDNAQLISLYAHTYQYTQNPLYKDIAEQTIQFVDRELKSPMGGYYSALDADSEGVEGKFYIWTQSEIEKILGENAGAFCSYFEVNKHGNWEHGQNILKYDSKKGMDKKLDASKKLLLEDRNKRIRPGLDDKILTSWNALLICGFVDAYNAFQDKTYLEKAIDTADFIITQMLLTDGSLLRNHKNGISNIAAMLDDYAQTIKAFIQMYQATLDEKYLGLAEKLTNYVILNFSDEQNNLFYYTHINENQLISRGMERSDNVIPASNSIMAENLLLLGHLFGNESFIERSERMVNMVSAEMQENIYYYAGWGNVALLHTAGINEIAITGPEYLENRDKIKSLYLPDGIVMGSKNESKLPLLSNRISADKNLIYLCKNKVCGLPSDNIELFIEELTSAYKDEI